MIRKRSRRNHETDQNILVQIACERSLNDSSVEMLFARGILKRFPRSTRVMATYHYIDGMTLEEVAQEVGLSVSGVRKRLRGFKSTVIEQEREHHESR